MKAKLTDNCKNKGFQRGKGTLGGHWAWGRRGVAGTPKGTQQGWAGWGKAALCVGSGQMRDNDRRGTAVKGKMKRKESWGQLSEHEVSHSLARGRKWKEVGRPACLNEHPGQVELLPCLPRLSWSIGGLVRCPCWRGIRFRRRVCKSLQKMPCTFLLSLKSASGGGLAHAAHSWESWGRTSAPPATQPLCSYAQASNSFCGVTLKTQVPNWGWLQRAGGELRMGTEMEKCLGKTTKPLFFLLALLAVGFVLLGRQTGTTACN